MGSQESDPTDNCQNWAELELNWGNQGLFLWLQRNLLRSDHVWCPSRKFLWPAGPAELREGASPLPTPSSPLPHTTRGLGRMNADAGESAANCAQQSLLQPSGLPQTLRKFYCASGCSGHVAAPKEALSCFQGASAVQRKKLTLRQSCWVLLGQEESSQSGANSSPSVTWGNLRSGRCYLRNVKIASYFTGGCKDWKKRLSQTSGITHSP